MFDAFNKFLDWDTWASLHWSDMERFYQALDATVLTDGFTASKLGEFLEARHSQQFGGVALKAEVRRTLEREAETIQQFLRATRPDATV